uniref:Uncharacterized protein n=1 Tax=Leersia perrieri TaxID=77586 RepID=A0A0D9XLY5_9ORYZ
MVSPSSSGGNISRAAELRIGMHTVPFPTSNRYFVDGTVNAAPPWNVNTRSGASLTFACWKQRSKGFSGFAAGEPRAEVTTFLRTWYAPSARILNGLKVSSRTVMPLDVVKIATSPALIPSSWTM